MKTTIKLHKGQWDAYHFEKSYGFAITGTKGGKTTLGALWAQKKINEFPLGNGLIAAPCYSDDTEILTDRGWILFKELTDKDKVAHLKNGKMEFGIPSERYVFPFNGEMIGLKHSQIDLLVTPNHKIYFKDAYKECKYKDWTLEPAENIYGRRIKLKRWGLWNKGKKRNKDWYEFLGFWFAEGCAEFNEKARKYRVVITQTKFCDYTDNLFERNNIKFKKDKRQSGGFNWTIYNKELAKEFAVYGKSLTKSIPSSIKNADVESLRAFLKGYEMGDGKTSDKQRILYTSSQKLADDLQDIANRCGYASSVRKYDYPKWKNPQYLVSILNHYGREPVVYKKEWYKKQYDGNVYCVKIGDGGGILLVRRNGISVWCGNTNKILEQATLDTFFGIFPEYRRFYKKQENAIYLPPGGKVYIRSTDEPLAIEGLNLDWAWMDEMGMMARLVWSIIKNKLAISNGQLLGTTNAYFLNWLYKEVYLPWLEKTDDQIDVFNWASTDNPAFPNKFAEQERARLSVAEFSRRYEGKFVRMEGLVYEIDGHVISKIEHEDFLRYPEKAIGAVDWGYSHPAAILIIKIKDGKYYIVDEWKEPKRTTDEIIQECIRFSKEYQVQMWYPDPAEPDRIEMMKKNNLLTGEVNKDVPLGISKVNQLFKERRLLLLDTCIRIQDEVDQYRYEIPKENRTGKEVPLKLNDDLVDCMRYAIMGNELGQSYTYQEERVEKQRMAQNREERKTFELL